MQRQETEPIRLVVLGAGGHAKVVVATARACGLVVDGAYDDNPGLDGGAILGVSILGVLAEVKRRTGAHALPGIGDNRTRARLAADYPMLHWATAVHPTALVADDVRIGPGSVVFAGAIIQPSSALGRLVILNTAATVDHDCSIGDFVHLAPGSHLAGGVTVGEGVLVGLGAVVLPGVSVGAWATVGAGAVVTRNVPPGTTVVGVPARKIEGV